MTDGDSENTGLESLEMLIDSIKNYRHDIEKGDIQWKAKFPLLLPL